MCLSFYLNTMQCKAMIWTMKKRFDLSRHHLIRTQVLEHTADIHHFLLIPSPSIILVFVFVSFSLEGV